MKPGTLVMLRIPANVEDIVSYAPPSGTIGEVVDAPEDCAHELPIGSVVVSFPRYIGKGPSGLWHVKTSWLIPLSDPDMDMTEDGHEPVGEIAN